MPTRPRNDSSRRRTCARARRATELVAMVVVLVASPAAFADTASDARAAYDVGAAAFDGGAFAEAAASFARADALAPNDVALELALKCAMRVGDGPLVRSLVARADARAGSEALTATAKLARDTFGAPGDAITTAPPQAAVVAAPVVPAPVVPTPVVPAPVLAAPHAATAEVPAPEPARTRLAPVWFWGATALTGALGVGAIASAAHTSSLHADYAKSPNDGLAADGRAAQARTNALFVATGVAAAGTAALGLFAVQWSKTQPEKGQLRAVAQGPILTLEGTY